MKTYIDKYFSRDFLKNTDLQKVGVYYYVPVENVKKEKLDELDDWDYEGKNYVSLDYNTIYNCDDFVNDYNGIEYDYTDEVEMYDVYNYLMSQKYNKYLVVAFNCTWSGASGYSFKDDYVDCFIRDYDSTMYVTGSCKSGKYLKLRESHHDVPCGHTTIVIGLTDNEYKRLENKDVDYIINYGKECLNKIIELEAN